MIIHAINDRPKWGKRDSCFSANTLVWTSRGKVPIAHLHAHDKIIAYSNGKTIECSIETVESHRSTSLTQMINLETTSGSLVVSHNHTLLVGENQFCWSEDFGKLTQGLFRSGAKLLRLVRSDRRYSHIYNVRLKHNDPYVTYLVGEDGIQASDRL